MSSELRMRNEKKEMKPEYAGALTSNVSVACSGARYHEALASGCPIQTPAATPPVVHMAQRRAKRARMKLLS